MKKKRFYNNKKRNTKWTEPEKGRKINFADKYIDAGNGSDRYDKSRSREKKPFFTKERFNAFAKYLIIVVCCFAVISVGYTAMDLYMERNAMPLEENNNDISADMVDVELKLKSLSVEPMAMDGGVMLSAVIDEINSKGYTSVTFDLKRGDGTIGYDSSLATIDMYGAESSPAVAAEKSIAEFLANDILPVGRISCYKDNVAAAGDLTAGITVDGKLYRDSQGNAYLNPDSEAAYNYIKGIIEEVKGMGVTVFVLDNCDLPEELSGSYNDGFEVLSKKLYNDFGSDIKLLESTAVSINADNAKALQKQWQEKTKNISSDNTVFSITAKDIDLVKEFLDNQGGVSYIISE
ncbi:MAG: putative glycoside hydrolase [Eubacterium sp.]